MCWAVPGRMIEIDGTTGIVELSGVKKDIALDLLSDVSIGDYVLVHAGYAIKKVDEERAKFTINFFKGFKKDA